MRPRDDARAQRWAAGGVERTDFARSIVAAGLLAPVARANAPLADAAQSLGAVLGAATSLEDTEAAVAILATAYAHRASAMWSRFVVTCRIRMAPLNHYAVTATVVEVCERARDGRLSSCTCRSCVCACVCRAVDEEVTRRQRTVSSSELSIEWVVVCRARTRGRGGQRTVRREESAG